MAKKSPEFGFTPSKDSERKKNIDFTDNHIIDIKPGLIGNRSLAAKFEHDAFGVGKMAIGRCEPPIEIPGVVSIEPGKSLVLIGPNGAGKTTIFDAIMETRAAHFSDTTMGEGAMVYGKSVHNRDTLRIARLNQEEILSNIESMSVDDVIEKMEEKTIEELKGADPDDIDWTEADATEKYDKAIENQNTLQRIKELRSKLIKLFRMDEFLDRTIDQLSGGERTKLSLSMVLLSEPDLLLLDEPTNHLDLETITKLSALFDAYKKAGVAILSISHVDSYLQTAGTDGTLEIKTTDGSRKVTSSNKPYGSYIRDRSRQDFTIVEGNIAWKNNAYQTSGVLVSPLHQKISLPDSPLQEVSIPSLLPREVWALSGNNGAGKTKLMEAMSDKIKGRNIFRREKGTSIAYMPQFWPDHVAQGTAEEFFNWIKEGVNGGPDFTSTKFSKAIKEIGFKHKEGGKIANQDLLRKKLAAFSGGEQRLLWFVAVSCFNNVDALFLDEPTNHMDIKLQELITKAIQDFPGTVVFSTHDLRLLEAISEDVGNKGGTMKPRNIVLRKENGLTNVSVSDTSPIDYIKNLIARATKEAQRIKI